MKTTKPRLTRNSLNTPVATLRAGMGKGIPFIEIADHVDVNFHLKRKHTAGPPLA